MNRRARSPWASLIDPAIDDLRQRAANDELLAPLVARGLAKLLRRQLATALASALELRAKLERGAREFAGCNGGTSRAADKQLSAILPGIEPIAKAIVDDWSGAQHEMLSRFRRDRALLTKSARLVDARAGFSEPHDGGRTVTLLIFDSGARIVYKPRPCDGEIIWFDLLRWMNAEGFETCFRVVDLIAREKYGWMSYVRRRVWRDHATARRFHFRWGAQAALAQMLRLADLHRENWVAAGAQPVLVDVEVFGQRSPGTAPASGLALPHLLGTGLLPLRASDGAGKYRGLAPFEACSKYRAEILRGYTRACEFIFAEPRRLHHVREVAKRGLASPRRRLLVRASAEYGEILRESLAPKHLFTREARPQFLRERLRATMNATAIADAETRALRRCSIPRFVACDLGFPPAEEEPVTREEMQRSLGILRERLSRPPY